MLQYKRYPPLRYPCVEPLINETYMDAAIRQQRLVELYRRIDYMKPSVDDGPPRKTVDVRLKLKKLVVEGIRLGKLEQDNKHMLKFILSCLNGPGRVDHFHAKTLQPHTTSLNYTGRKQTVERLNLENAAMLKRIRMTKTSYSRVKLLMDYQSNARLQRGRTDVYKRWEKNAQNRRYLICTGQSLVRSCFKEIDSEALRLCTEMRHRQCFPPCSLQAVRPLPVPLSSRSSPGASPVDHQRCFTPHPAHYPRYPYRPPTTGGWPFRENKTSALRQRLQKEKIEALTPLPFVIYRRPPSPAILKEGHPPVQENKANRLRAEMLRAKVEGVSPSSPPGNAPSPSPALGKENQGARTENQSQNQNQSALVSCPRSSSSRTRRTACRNQIVLDTLTPMLPSSTVGSLPPLSFVPHRPGKAGTGNKQTNRHGTKQPSDCKFILAPPKNNRNVKESKKAKEVAFRRGSLSVPVVRSEAAGRREADTCRMKTEITSKDLHPEQDDQDRASAIKGGSEAALSQRVRSPTLDSNSPPSERLSATCAPPPEPAKEAWTAKESAGQSRSDADVSMGHGVQTLFSLSTWRSFSHMDSLWTAGRHQAEADAAEDAVPTSQDDNPSSSEMTTVMLHGVQMGDDSTDVLDSGSANCAVDEVPVTDRSLKDSDGQSEQACPGQDTDPTS